MMTDNEQERVIRPSVTLRVDWECNGFNEAADECDFFEPITCDGHACPSCVPRRFYTYSVVVVVTLCGVHCLKVTQDTNRVDLAKNRAIGPKLECA
jgi:hypothetical protein